MITLPPSEADLHAYVDGRLTTADRAALEHWLAAHPQMMLKVRGWQRDAQSLRAALGSTQPSDNPSLDPALIRQRVRVRRHNQWATAALLVIAIGLGGVGGWKARGALWEAPLPMTDALQAYRLFAWRDDVASDWSRASSGAAQGWLDAHLNNNARLPDLTGAGFHPLAARLMSTDQGAAAMVTYEDEQGRRLSFYIRPPGPRNFLLSPGTRRDGELQADYGSTANYNYALIGRSDDPATEAARTLMAKAI